MIKILPLIAVLISGCGSSGTPTDTVSDPNALSSQSFKGTWYFPSGCNFGVETARVWIGENSNTAQYAITFNHYYNDINHIQSLDNVDITISSNSNGVFFEYYTNNNSQSGSGVDLFMIDTASYQSNQLTIDNGCSAGNQMVLLKEGQELNSIAYTRYLSEANAIRDANFSAFNDAWSVELGRLAGLGLLGSSIECSSRKTMFEDYLSSMRAALVLARNKYSILSLVDQWSSPIYDELKAADLLEAPYKSCTILPDVETTYVLLYF